MRNVVDKKKNKKVPHHQLQNPNQSLIKIGLIAVIEQSQLTRSNKSSS